ncbi:MAG: hypothetical protein WKF81_13960, partial [Thermomicrobiales bacterium]
PDGDGLACASPEDGDYSGGPSAGPKEEAETGSVVPVADPEEATETESVGSVTEPDGTLIAALPVTGSGQQ